MPVSQYIVCFPGRCSPSLIPDNVRCQRESGIRREDERRGQGRRGVEVREMGTENERDACKEAEDRQR